jgi:plastocyanin
MQYRWIRKPALLGLGLTATVAAALAGCGGPTADKDNATVVPPPNEVSTSPRASSGGAAKAPATASTSSTSAPSSSSPTAAPSVAAEGWGTLKGQVTLSGTAPQPAVLQEVGKAVKDPEICAKTTPIMSEKLVVNSGNKGVKYAFVFIQRPTAVNEEAKKATLAKHLEFDQKNCTYVPHALAVMTGQTVTVKSSDPTNHNVNFQLTYLNKNPLIAPGTSLDITPDSVEKRPGQVSCSIHPWMLAFWLVLDHPYFAVTDENGNYEIKNVPAGTQKVVVWQEAAGYVSSASGDSVNIKPNDATTKDFAIDSAKVK